MASENRPRLHWPDKAQQCCFMGVISSDWRRRCEKFKTRQETGTWRPIWRIWPTFQRYAVWLNVCKPNILSLICSLTTPVWVAESFWEVDANSVEMGMS